MTPNDAEGKPCEAGTPGCIVEVCDDGVNAQGVTASGDGCSADCLSLEICGDGYVNTVPYPARDAEGKIIPGQILPAEGCDDGVVDELTGLKIDTATCNSDCSVARCGDSINNQAADEQCDPGTGITPNNPKKADRPTFACNDDCTLSSCGDTRVNSVGPNNVAATGEQCDLGSFCAKLAPCTTAAECPPGLSDQLCIPRNVECCTAACQNALCGDKVTQTVTCGGEPAEKCDDGKYCDDGTPCTANAQCPGDAANRCRTRNNANCSFDCRSVGECGDGYRNDYPPFNEVCDDGKHCADATTSCTSDAQCASQSGADKTCRKRNTPVCNATCQSVGACGDGILNDYEPFDEICDDGRQCANGTDCTQSGVCSDGSQCTTRDADGCSADCASLEVCGDKYLNNYLHPMVSDGRAGGRVENNTTVYTISPGQLINAREVCDNGRHCPNGTSCQSDADCGGTPGTCIARVGDGCSTTCRVERGWECIVTPISDQIHRNGGTCAPVCGDREMWGNEECDDGNLNDGDGCDSNCELEDGFTCPGTTGGQAGPCQSTCGDGFIRGFEECDDGDKDDGDGCSANCRIELGWLCPDRAAQDLSQATNNVALACTADCGDFVIRGDEQCDDGRQCDDGTPCSTNANCDDIGDELCITRDGDGCAADCTFEDGYSCPAGLALVGGVCVAICGDGLVRGAENCDDGIIDGTPNPVSGDGCDTGCQVEVGWTCPINVGGNGAGGPCAPTCGDGLIRGVETCDEGLPGAGETGGCRSCVAWTEEGFYCPTALLAGGLCTTRCGDGIRVTKATSLFDSLNEDCDAGLNNSNNGDCTLSCEVATCSDEFHNSEGTLEETDVDCGGVCASLATPKRCALNKGCVANTDCQTNFCDTLEGVCKSPPLVAAPTLYVLEGQTLAIDVVEDLFGGNTDIDLTTFSLVDPTESACRGSLEYDAADDPDLVDFAPTAASSADDDAEGCTVGVDADYTDTFSYQVCAPDNVPCVESTATIVINRLPSVANAPVQCFPVDTKEAQINLLTLYSDPDGNPIDASTITHTGTGGDFSRTGTTVTFAPDSEETGATYNLTLSACDANTTMTQGCDTGSWTLQWNEPPTVVGRTGSGKLKVFVGEEADEVPIFDGAGAIVTGRGDVVNAFTPVTVGSSDTGPFGPSTPTSRGTCAVVDDDITYEAGSLTGNDSCWVRVCEACSGSDVCSVARLDYQLFALPVANDDQVFGLEAEIPTETGAYAQFNVADLLSNDTPSGLTNFSFVSATTFCLGQVVNVGGTITYTGPSGLDTESPCRTNDRFTYSACSPDIASRCDMATVHIEINRRPVLSDVFTCSPVNTPNRSINVGLLFTDLDGQLRNDSIEAEGTDGNASISGSVVTWTPSNAATARSYTVNLEACDNGVVSDCDTSVWTAVWNDPPVLRTFNDASPIPVEQGTTAATISLESGDDRIITSTGLVTGVQGTTNPIASIAVGAFATGPFSATPVATTFGTCGISGGNVTYTAGNIAGIDSCFVQVCESCTGTNVCSVTRIPYKVVAPPVPVADSLLAVEQAVGTATGTISVATLLANDSLIDPARFELVLGSGTPDCSGTTVTLLDGVVSYSSAAGRVDDCVTTDTFYYRVYSLDIPTLFRDGEVNVTINRRPTLAAAHTCMPVGSNRGSYTVATPNFMDLDGNGVGTVSVTNTSGGTGFASVSGSTVTWSPDDRDDAVPYDLSLAVCDDASSPACGTGSWRVTWNDPPQLSTTFTLNCASPENATLCVGTGESIDLPLLDAGSNKLVTGYGAVAAVADGANFIGAVNITQNDTYGSCSVITTGGVPTAIRYTASGTPTPLETPDTCSVQVCEICDGGPVCHTQTVNVRVFVNAVAGDDEFGILSTSSSPFSFPRSLLTGNDDGVNVNSLTLPSPATTCGGTVTKVGSGAGEQIEYTKPTPAQMVACNYFDSFTYNVEKTGQGGTVTATVRIYINQAPTLNFADAFVCRPTGTTSHVLNLVPGIYSDPDDTNTTLSALTAVEADELATMATSTTNKTITLTPVDPNTTPRRFTVDVTATDDALTNTINNSRGQAMGTWNAVWNDPPVLTDLEDSPTNLARGATRTFDFDVGANTSLGVVNGFLDPANTTITVTVSDEENGTYGTSANTTLGTCALDVGDDRTVVYSASGTTGADSCWVRVCEPCGDTPVCTKQRIALNVVTCEDTAAAGVTDAGCSLAFEDALPICDTTGASPVCRECVVANDCPVGDAANGGEAGGWTCVSNLCVGPPAATAVNDDVGFLVDRPDRTYTIASLVSNDTAVDASTFAIDVAITVCSGSATVVGTDVLYVPPADPENCVGFADTFIYEVCSPFDSEECDTATVTVRFNSAPVLTDTFICVPLGTSMVTLNAGQSPFYNDPEFHPINASTIDWDPTDNVELSVSTLTYTPVDMSIPLAVTYTIDACDTALDPGCDMATWEIRYNDGPGLAQALTANVAYGTSVAFTNTQIILNWGTVTGVAIGDPLASRSVSATQTGGTYAATTMTVEGGSCEVTETGISYTAPAGTATSDTCWVEVCELCTGSSPVCSRVAITFTLDVCFDTAGAGLQDSGCGAGTPICDTTPNPNVCRGCVGDSDCPIEQVCDNTLKVCAACTDDGVGAGATDTGCEVPTPACDELQCVECTDSGHCSGLTPHCDVAANECALCLNDQPAGTQDTGCTVDFPACDGGTVCVECLANADCDGATPACNTTSKECQVCVDSGPGVEDAGCSPALPACNADGTMCVECTVNDDCGVDEACGTGNTCYPAWTVSYCELQHPPTASLFAGGTLAVYGRYFAAGLTSVNPHANEPLAATNGLIRGVVGYGPSDSSPIGNGAWTWSTTGAPSDPYDFTDENNDEWLSSITVPSTTGTYDYAFRFSGDGGETWLYCDTNGVVSGADTAPDNYDTAFAGKLTVVPLTAPDAPTEASATAGEEAAMVSWTEPVSDGGSPITSYTATAFEDGSKSCTTLDGETLGCTVTGLAAGTSYTFTVVATNAEGDSTASTPSAPVVPYTIPGAPQNVTASLTVDDQVIVGWQAPVSDGFSPILTYTSVVYDAGVATAFTCQGSGAAAVTCTTQAISGTGPFTVTVFATNAAGADRSPLRPLACPIPYDR